MRKYLGAPDGHNWRPRRLNGMHRKNVYLRERSVDLPCVRTARKTRVSWMDPARSIGHREPSAGAVGILAAFMLAALLSPAAVFASEEYVTVFHEDFDTAKPRVNWHLTQTGWESAGACNGCAYLNLSEECEGGAGANCLSGLFGSYDVVD
jgi:hypothetical protein